MEAVAFPPGGRVGDTACPRAGSRDSGGHPSADFRRAPPPAASVGAAAGVAPRGAGRGRARCRGRAGAGAGGRAAIRRSGGGRGEPMGGGDPPARLGGPWRRRRGKTTGLSSVSGARGFQGGSAGE